MVLASSSSSKEPIFSLPSSKRKASLEKAVNLYEANVHLVETYLASRGIPIEVAYEWRLGYVADPLPEHERERGRLVIPYLTPGGVVDIKFRCLENHDCKKYEEEVQERTSNKHFHHRKYDNETGSTARLFGVLNLKADSDVLCLCEGEMDTLVCSSIVGVPAVGISGAKKWKSHWAYVFEGYGEIVVLRHGDQAGREMAEMVSGRLYNTRIAPLPEGEDVNSFVQKYGVDAFRERSGFGDV